MKDAHLWKRILNSGVECHPPFFNPPELVSQIVTAPIIVVSREPPAETRHIEMTDYRCCSVPFRGFWVEQGATFIDKETFLPAGTGYTGYLVSALKDDQGHAMKYLEFSVIPGDSRILLAAGVSFRLSSAGDYVPGSVTAKMPDAIRSQFTEDQVAVNVRGSLAQLLEVLVMLGCKNVSLAPHENDPKQVKRAIKRHGGTPESYRYHTLVVRPPGASKDSPAQEIGIMPRHVCRGHFAEYGPEFNKGLLFGKYSGRFYVPPHLKGDKKNGVVEKDYAIPAS